MRRNLMFWASPLLRALFSCFLCYIIQCFGILGEKQCALGFPFIHSFIHLWGSWDRVLFYFLFNTQSWNLCLLGGSHLKSQNYLWQDASSLMGISFKQASKQTNKHLYMWKVTANLWKTETTYYFTIRAEIWFARKKMPPAVKPTTEPKRKST